MEITLFVKLLRFFFDKEILRLIMPAHARKTCKLVQFCDPTRKENMINKTWSDIISVK